MTPTFQQKLDEVLCRFAVDTHDSKPGQDETPNFDRAKQAIASLTKELVAEAKPGTWVDPEDTDDLEWRGYVSGVSDFEQNLLKELEEN